MKASRNPIRPVRFLIIATLFLLAAAACAPLVEPEPLGPFSTPTPFPLAPIGNTEESLEDLIRELENGGPILEATAESVDLDQLVAAEEAREEQALLNQLEKEIVIEIDAAADQRPISPLIYGVANPPGIYLRTLLPTVSAWGGEGAVRFNWINGNSWNLGAPNSYRNTPVDEDGGGNRIDSYMENAETAGAATYIVLPTIGWVAKNNNPATCAFPAADGTCTTGNASTCQSSDVEPDPTLTSRPVTPEDVLSLVDRLHTAEYTPDILALTHEPELWGITHYDVHPNCTTYQEIFDTYVRYAELIRARYPEVELAGPGTCCWFFYWNSGAGEEDKARNGRQDFLPWFLEQHRAYEAATGVRLLDILDIHYYPEHITSDGEDGLVGDLRLRAARSLYDKTYIDESWIREPIYLIPRMRSLIDDHYPGTRLAISEWNFGADATVNGGLAIADVLGVMGREGVYMAAYSSFPAFRSPGFWAFKIYTNYNNLGGRFGDLAVKAESNDVDLVSTYAALNSETGNLHVIVINKVEGFEDKPITLTINNFDFVDRITRFVYAGNPSDPGSERIESSFIDPQARSFILAVPPSSITHLVIPAAQGNTEPER